MRLEYLLSGGGFKRVSKAFQAILATAVMNLKEKVRKGSGSSKDDRSAAQADADEDVL